MIATIILIWASVKTGNFAWVCFIFFTWILDMAFFIFIDTIHKRHMDYLELKLKSRRIRK